MWRRLFSNMITISRKEHVMSEFDSSSRSPRGHITVGLYLDKNLVEKAKKRGLNLSKVMEQTLTTIINSSETQNQQTSSQFLGAASFPKKVQCRGPDLNRRQPGLQPVALPSWATSATFGITSTYFWVSLFIYVSSGILGYPFAIHTRNRLQAVIWHLQFSQPLSHWTRRFRFLQR